MALKDTATPAPVSPAPPAGGAPSSTSLPPRGALPSGFVACADGRHIVPTWQGEYPGPIVQVDRPVVVNARLGPCQVAAPVTCTVPAGLYHPWAAGAGGYVTVRGTDRYRARRAVEVEPGGGRVVPAGEVIDVVAYLGEGFCAFGGTWDGVLSSCPEQVADGQGEVFEPLGTEPVGAVEQQFFSVACAEGPQGWVLAGDALLGTPGVREGVLVGYGEVGRAEP